MYAIGELITRVMAETGLRKTEIVRRLGFDNVAKGLRRLNACLNDGNCENALLTANLATALGVEATVVETAIAQTREQLAIKLREQTIAQERHDREHFVPYIYVLTSRHRPSFISGAAVMGMRMKYIIISKEMHIHNIG